jgi:hypothetical protein
MGFMTQHRPTFESLYEDAQDGTLAADEDFPRAHWGIRSTDNDLADHPGLTLAHVAARAGHLPDFMDDDKNIIWTWKAYDGWTVRDAWEEGNAPAMFMQAGAV